MFLNYIKVANLLILRLQNFETFGQVIIEVRLQGKIMP